VTSGASKKQASQQHELHTQEVKLTQPDEKESKQQASKQPTK